MGHDGGRDAVVQIGQHLHRHELAPGQPRADADVVADAERAGVLGGAVRRDVGRDVDRQAGDPAPHRGVRVDDTLERDVLSLIHISEPTRPY